MKLTNEVRYKIERLGIARLLYLWRNLPTNSELMCGESGQYIADIIVDARANKPAEYKAAEESCFLTEAEALVRISKDIGIPLSWLVESVTGKEGKSHSPS